MPKYEKGTVVCPIAEPSKKGAITEVIPGESENRYRVFIDGENKTYYASQIREEKESAGKRSVLPLRSFHARLSALQIQHPASSTLYSLNAARVDFVPYQFRPVLKFIASDRPRLLIADGVGVGKTIEAGLIFRELQARREVNSALIICPKALVTDKKWRMEMKRFDEEFTKIDGKEFDECIEETDLDGVWPAKNAKTVIPYSLFDEARLYGTKDSKSRQGRMGLKDLNPPPHFDLVIVDEAHHIRNTDTYRHEAVKFFCENAEAVLFLTATPVQLGSDDLFVLLNTLRPDLIVDKDSFEYMAEPNEYINKAIQAARGTKRGWEENAQRAVEKAGQTEWGQSILSRSPDFRETHSTLENAPLTKEERVEVIRDLKELHTFSDLINRTRRRDIEEFTTRKPQTVKVPFTEEQREVHEGILRVQARILNRIHSDIPIQFLMTTIRRQAASCLFGLTPLLEDILRRRIGELVEEEAPEAYDMGNAGFVDDIQEDIKQVLDEAAKMRGPDKKLEALKRIIAEKQGMSNNRIMLFSTFRHTLSYLKKQLGKEEHRLAVMHGGTPDEERVRIRERFRLPREAEDSLDVVLFSEVACEGLDFEFCDCIVNYDLPWNPMRVEQRIGRIDRHGQKSDTVAIYNMITPGTVDAEIYERCLKRIGVFEKAIGGNEKILGEISQKIHDIAENFELTKKERKARLQQLADNEIRDIQEQQRLEQRQKDLFGIRLPHNQMEDEIDRASSYWISAEAIENLVRRYLQSLSDSDGRHIIGQGPLKNLRTSREMRGRLLDDYRSLDVRQSSLWREWRHFLRRGGQHLSITFDADCARDNRDAVFVTAVHPLVVQAANAFNLQTDLYTALEIRNEDVQPGDYPFAIYQWRYHGVREELELHPVCAHSGLNEDFLKILENGKSIPCEFEDLPGEDTFRELDETHYEQWEMARRQHREETGEHVAYKRESLRKSYSARLDLLKDQLSQTEDKNIQRMKKSQIQNAQQEYKSRMDELESAQEKADITAEPVAYGTIRVKSDAK